jgi:hypothetical protein
MFSPGTLTTSILVKRSSWTYPGLSSIGSSASRSGCALFLKNALAFGHSVQRRIPRDPVTPARKGARRNRSVKRIRLVLGAPSFQQTAMHSTRAFR